MHIKHLRRGLHLFGNSLAKRYDAVIVGGGLNGFTLAALMATNPVLQRCQVLMLEHHKEGKFSRPKTFSNRVVALAPSSVKIFNDLGVWQFVADRARPVTKMCIWESESDSRLTLVGEESQELPDNMLACIVENDNLLHELQQKVRTLPQVETVYGSSVSDIQFPDKSGDSAVKVILNSGESFETSLLVGADGYNSFVRQAANISTIGRRLHQDLIAIVATLRMDEGSFDPSIAWQKFLHRGPIAYLPLNKQFCSLVWSTNREHADQLLKMSPDYFIEALNSAMLEVVLPSNPVFNSLENALSKGLRQLGLEQQDAHSEEGKFSSRVPVAVGVEPNSIASYPIGFQYATRFVGPRLALVGDAAHRVLPLAGQGLNLGLSDARELVDQMSKAVLEGTTIHNDRFLLEYETRRQRSTTAFSAMIEVIYWLYCAESRHLPAPISVLSKLPLFATRSIGLNLLNRTPLLKRLIINTASKGKFGFNL